MAVIPFEFNIFEASPETVKLPASEPVRTIRSIGSGRSFSGRSLGAATPPPEDLGGGRKSGARPTMNTHGEHRRQIGGSNICIVLGYTTVAAWFGTLRFLSDIGFITSTMLMVAFTFAFGLEALRRRRVAMRLSGGRGRTRIIGFILAGLLLLPAIVAGALMLWCLGEDIWQRL